MILLKSLGIVVAILILLLISYSCYRALYDALIEFKIKRSLHKQLKHIIKAQNQVLVKELYRSLCMIQDNNIKSLLNELEMFDKK